MADTEQIRDAGRRLATDLKDLRKARKVKTDSIVKATRLSSDVLESFEESALVDHPAYNRVYLRSVMTSYARVVELKEQDALKSLEEALAGTYTDRLRRIYIHGEQVADTDGGADETAPADEESDAAQLPFFEFESAGPEDQTSDVSSDESSTSGSEKRPSFWKYVIPGVVTVMVVFIIYLII